MFSWFTATDPDAPNFHPVSERPDLFGKLGRTDLEWACASGLVTETQTFYHFLEDETMIMCQVIHSSAGLWPSIQFTCKIHKPHAKEPVWYSIGASNFLVAQNDRRSCKADQFSVTYGTLSDPNYPESYAIKVTLPDKSQISLDVKRPASVPGFKVGNGPKGGFSYFGPDLEKPDGYVVHRFWPRTIASGAIIRDGQCLEVNGIGMMVHAIQGMRPDLIATRWNFANFQSNLHGGVSAIQMEFTTLSKYGRRGPRSGGVTVNVGSLVLGGKLALITAETKWPDEEQPARCESMSRATHMNPMRDDYTGYAQPSSIDFTWAGQSLLGSEGSSRSICASLTVDVGGPSNPKGLVEKVDVLAEIPDAVKLVVNFLVGTKPYIYQWQNPVKLKVHGPEIIPGLSNGLEIDGLLYNEASFIS